MGWDVTTPASTDDLRQGDNVIREFKQALDDAFNSSGVFPVSAGSPEFQYRGGKGDTASRPTSGEGGFYFDTDKNDFLRDTGSGWERIAHVLASGTKAVFYQSAAPTGWTIETGHNERLLNISESAGGTDSGSWSATQNTTSGASHDHDYVRSIVSASGFLHGLRFYKSTYGSGTHFTFGVESNFIGGSEEEHEDRGSSELAYAYGGSHNTDYATSESSWSHTHTFSHAYSNHLVAKVLICSKD